MILFFIKPKKKTRLTPRWPVSLCECCEAVCHGIPKINGGSTPSLLLIS